MKAAQFYSAVKGYGINFASGVPCGIMKKIFFCFLNDSEMSYISASREEDAVGIAAGAYLAGKKPIVLMQNSGLANSINALASLLIPYRIPVLFLVAWRGYPKDKNEPLYHRVMGKSTIKIMKDIGIPVHIISKENPEIAISEAIKDMREKQLPAVMLYRRGILE